MRETPAQFFEGLVPQLVAAGFSPQRPGTNTGMNVYSHTRGHRQVYVTVNYVPPDSGDYVVVKLTVNRGTPGGSTPVFDAIHANFKKHEDRLRGTDGVYWTWSPSKSESKVQVRRRIGVARNTVLYRWIVENARVLKDWALWSKSVDTGRL